ncbi:hypothetical protein [Streptomyces sp. MMS24-I29]|uniref:hypothetical protein n=1 Tax=Streptomyces sp. MMS24-I29 TaxID=3351480 RepID=UPI003C7CAE95
MRIDGIDGFHVEREERSTFASGFTRWIERRSTGSAYPGLIELVGIAARERGLAPDEVALVARMTGTTLEAVIQEYKRDNTTWAQTQAALDQRDLARLDTHLDEIARQGQGPPCIP